MNFCHIAASCLLTYASVAFYTLHYGSISRDVTKGARGAQFHGRRITLGSLKYCTGRRMIVEAPKSHNNVTSTFFNTVYLLPKDLRCFLPWTPSILVTPLSIRRLVPSRNSSTHFYVEKIRCRQTADSRTAQVTALKLVSRFQFGRL